MRGVTIHPTGVLLTPNSARVLVRSFIPAEPARISHILDRALALVEDDVERQLAEVTAGFEDRHMNLRVLWRQNYERVKGRLPATMALSEERQLYIGALFSGEYALESAALFNPSIVLHPDQGGLDPGMVRFIMSLRATGEGHISSIEFRSGTMDAGHAVVLEGPSRFVTAPEMNPDPTYQKSVFVQKLTEMGFGNEGMKTMMAPLGENFTLRDLEGAMQRSAQGGRGPKREAQRTLDCVRWLAESNYEVHFRPSVAISERIIFPISSNESNGMEDARFVRFQEDDGEVVYYATYTAYNGRAILPQLLETRDFLNFRALTLNGSAVQNKGMALFPRKVRGCYTMLSRWDDENLYLLTSENPHFWSDPQLLRGPSQPWEGVKIGNCGSPIETEAGWLVITHGVGPMRRYCIGALLLDLENPLKVLGHLAQPLIEPAVNTREGYVPNVVYSCGAMLHGGRVILPYGMSDTATTIVTIELAELLEALLDNP